MGQYKAVAQLGTFTPTHLPGATVVTAAQVQQLIAKGAVVVDTRNEKEYRSKQIQGAVFVPYHEKSLKDVAYDAALDDFSGIAKLDPARPTIFHCNGAECWKSYKASRAALAKGFRQCRSRPDRPTGLRAARRPRRTRLQVRHRSCLCGGSRRPRERTLVCASPKSPRSSRASHPSCTGAPSASFPT
jgi:rhodanese-related sulfurtransferase